MFPDCNRVTIGGVNAPICHGAGAEHGTISDYVRVVEYVDANGISQTISDPEHLRAAAGCFGLLGIVTHVTLELDPMTYAVMQPEKVPVAQSIPPIKKTDIPLALRTDGYDKISDNDLAVWKNDFAKRAAEDYYSEWFWFTYQKRTWVNTWKNTSDRTGLIDYPDSADVFLQWFENWMGGVVTETPFFAALPGAWQAQLLATLGMTTLPPTDGEDKKPVFKTKLPDALHFRRGVCLSSTRSSRSQADRNVIYRSRTCGFGTPSFRSRFPIFPTLRNRIGPLFSKHGGTPSTWSTIYLARRNPKASSTPFLVSFIHHPPSKDEELPCD